MFSKGERKMYKAINTYGPLQKKDTCYTIDVFQEG